MSIYSITTPFNSAIIAYAHPAIHRFKEKKPYAILGPLGYVSVYNVFGQIKDNSAPNGSIASKDVKINNYQELSSREASLQLSTLRAANFDTNDFLGPISQGPNAACSLIPMLHQIQSQLDFPMDYNKFLNCVPREIPKNIPDLAKNAYRNIIKKFFDSPPVNGNNDDFWVEDGSSNLNYLIGLNLMFGGKCIPVPERPQIEKCTNGYVLPPINIDKECDSKCARKSIRLEAVAIPESEFDKIKKLPDMCAYLSEYGPQSVTVRGDQMVRLWLMYQAQTDLSWSQLAELDTEDLKEMLGEKWYNTVSNIAHEMTLTNCSGPDGNGEYKLTFYNSWSENTSNEFIMTWKSDKDFDLHDYDKPNEGWMKLAQRIQLKVVPCDGSRPTMTSDEIEKECQEDICKKLGYDKKSENLHSDCPCECDEVTNNRGIKIKKLYYSSKDWYYTCNCKSYSAEQLCGGSFNSKQEYISDCDCLCKNPDSPLPCSGYDAGPVSAQQLSVFNITPVSEIVLY